MSAPPSTLTYEGILELYRQTAEQMRETDRLFQESKREMDRLFQESRQETDRLFQESKRETDRKFQESAEQIKRTHREISALGSHVGEIVENMVAGDIVAQFRDLGYNVKERSQNRVFGEEGTSESSEDDVLDHIERLEKYRRHVDAKSHLGQRRFVGAVAGTVVAENVINFAHKNGLYVIIQSARAVEILPQPAGFVAQQW